MPPGISWEGLGDLIPVNPPPSEEEEQTGEVNEPGSGNIDVPLRKEEQDEFSEPPLTWHDIALSIGAKLMGTAREQVRIKLGYSTSAVGSSPVCLRGQLLTRI